DVGAYEYEQTGNSVPFITEGAKTSVTMDQNGSPTAFDLTLHATDANADTLTWSISSTASNGTASASGTGNSKVIGYTPDYDFTGWDSFDVQVNDGNGGTDTISVWVNVKSPGLVVWIDNNHVCGFNWPLGATVTLTIDDPNTTLSPDYTDTQTVPTENW